MLIVNSRNIEKYESDGEMVFEGVSNTKFNLYLKEIADVVGLDFNLTHHIARKIFASTVLLYNDVPMEIVSKLLGHSSMKITQDSYGKIVQKKISEEMNKLMSNKEITIQEIRWFLLCTGCFFISNTNYIWHKVILLGCNNY